MQALSRDVSEWSGRTSALAIALALIVVWLVTGPLFHFSDTWQLVINTTTTVVTFLMVFLIQRAQNKNDKAVALKLNEVIASIEGASNRLIGAEAFTEEELEVLRQHYRRLVVMAERDSSLTKSHSVEEAESRHSAKASRRAPGVNGRDRGRRPGRGERSRGSPA